MKPLSKTYKELGIAFSFPIEITDDNGKTTYYEHSEGWWERWEFDAHGNKTYYEDRKGYWEKWERDANGKATYFQDSKDYWEKYEYNADGNETYYEDRYGNQRGNPPSAKTCEGKVVEVDGIKYKLTAL